VLCALRGPRPRTRRVYVKPRPFATDFFSTALPLSYVNLCAEAAKTCQPTRQLRGVESDPQLIRPIRRPQVGFCAVIGSQGLPPHAPPCNSCHAASGRSDSLSSLDIQSFVASVERILDYQKYLFCRRHRLRCGAKNKDTSPPVCRWAHGIQAIDKYDVYYLTWPAA
jgi:hypothetical protein